MLPNRRRQLVRLLVRAAIVAIFLAPVAAVLERRSQAADDPAVAGMLVAPRAERTGVVTSSVAQQAEDVGPLFERTPLGATTPGFAVPADAFRRQGSPPNQPSAPLLGREGCDMIAYAVGERTMRVHRCRDGGGGVLDVRSDAEQ